MYLSVMLLYQQGKTGKPANKTKKDQHTDRKWQKDEQPKKTHNKSKKGRQASLFIKKN